MSLKYWQRRKDKEGENVHGYWLNKESGAALIIRNDSERSSALTITDKGKTADGNYYVGVLIKRKGSPIGGKKITRGEYSLKEAKKRAKEWMKEHPMRKSSEDNTLNIGW